MIPKKMTSQYKWIVKGGWIITCPICGDALLNRFSDIEAICRVGHKFNINEKYEEDMMPFRKMTQDLFDKLAKLAFKE